MVLSRFRRPDADLRVHVSRSEFRPGDEFEARVSLSPRSGFQVRQGKAELVYVETYIQVVRTQHGASYHRKRETKAVSGSVFMDNGSVRRGVSHSTDVNLTVPSDALPTLSGTRFMRIDPGIAWEVQATMDVAGARDLRESQEVTVVRPPASDGHRRDEVVAENRHRRCVLTMTLSQDSARSGDRLDGRFQAEMLDDVNVTDVRVELVRTEKFGNEAKDYVVDKAIITEDASLSSGHTMEDRFQLDLGRVQAPTLETDKSSVKWQVKGILSRRMQPDLRVEQPLQVDF